MIARVIIPILLMIVVADAYIDFRFLRRQRWWRRLLWWLPALLMAGYAVGLALVRNFLPDNAAYAHVFLFLFGLLVVPKLVFAVCSLVGLLLKRLFRSRRNYGNAVGLVGVLVVWYVLFYGVFVGFRKLEVRHVEIASADLPAAFDGYKIVQWSDAHVGTLTGSREWLLQRAVDSINAQHPDLIAFTGDLQNQRPKELYAHARVLSALRARDGVYTVLGNHDYGDYVKADGYDRVRNMRETMAFEDKVGWHLLMNQHDIVRRGGDSIVVAGMENDGEGRFPQRGNLTNALRGIHREAFVVMLEHDPTSWRRKILPHSHVQLTLSGHTHAGQFAVGGWSPVALRYREWAGVYYADSRALSVSSGLGGVIPFRFGVPGEIVVITLRKQ